MLLWLLVACRPSAPPTLAELRGLGDEERAGHRLMEAPEGLLRLDTPEAPRATAVVAVHGFESEGSEWVGPLAEMAGWGDELYFYRWSWRQCPSSAVLELDHALDTLVAEHSEIQHLVVIGHSYGGLVAAMLGQTQAPARPMQLELIAAPLAGMERLQSLCPDDGLGDGGPQPDTRWRQWRTVHASDGAFRDLPMDPQVRALAGLTVVELPAEWQGGRLGHNRSIQWVTDQLSAERAAPTTP